jgi:diacylglycerol kinase family enzyme
MHALLFHNPTAGDGSHSRKKLLALFKKAGISATYCSTKGSDFKDMLKEEADLFIAAGGDGTVAKVLKKMPDRHIPLAILPLGTANNIARSLGVTGRPKDLVAGLKGARKQRFDIGLACGPWGRRLFVESAGLGLLTEAMVRIDSINIERADGMKLGRDTFRKVLSEAKPIRVDMSVDGRNVEQEVILLEIMNIPYAGPGIALAPQGGLGDGRFDIVCIGPDQRKDMLAWLGASSPNAPPPVTQQQGRKIVLRWDGALLRLDDDCPSTATRSDKLALEIESEPATILVPKPDAGKRASRRRSEA